MKLKSYVGKSHQRTSAPAHQPIELSWFQHEAGPYPFPIPCFARWRSSRVANFRSIAAQKRDTVLIQLAQYQMIAFVIIQTLSNMQFLSLLYITLVMGTMHCAKSEAPPCDPVIEIRHVFISTMDDTKPYARLYPLPKDQQPKVFPIRPHYFSRNDCEVTQLD